MVFIKMKFMSGMDTWFSGSTATGKFVRFFRFKREFSGRLPLKISGFPSSTGKYAGGSPRLARFAPVPVGINCMTFLVKFLPLINVTFQKYVRRHSDNLRIVYGFQLERGISSQNFGSKYLSEFSNATMYLYVQPALGLIVGYIQNAAEWLECFYRD